MKPTGDNQTFACIGVCCCALDNFFSASTKKTHRIFSQLEQVFACKADLLSLVLEKQLSDRGDALKIDGFIFLEQLLMENTRKNKWIIHSSCLYHLFSLKIKPQGAPI